MLYLTPSYTSDNKTIVQTPKCKYIQQLASVAMNDAVKRRMCAGMQINKKRQQENCWKTFSYNSHSFN